MGARRVTLRLSARVVLAVAAIGLTFPARNAAAAGECPSDVSGVVTWSYSGGSCIGTFTNSGTWSVPAGVTSFDYLLVGGGGAGATGSNANGGSGGSVTESTGRSITGGSSVTVTVGAGGASAGASGGQSSLVWTGNSITAAGGSGGGRSGNGANGTSSSMTGSSVIYGSSGGQGNDGGSARPGGSGAGQGATGVFGACNSGQNGTANRGGGGGGGARCDYGGFAGNLGSGLGGSGLVVVKYLAAFQVSSFTTTVASPTSVASLTYTLTFDTAIDAATLTGADFSNGGSATGCTFSASPTSGSASTFTITVSGCSDGTVVPGITASSTTASDGRSGPGSSTSGTSVTVDRTAPAAPTSDLIADSDTGSSSTDNLTNDTTPTMAVIGGSSGETATISATDGSQTKTCSYTVGSATSCTLAELTAGTWTVTSTLTDQAGNTSASGAAISLTVDTTAPSAPSTPDLAASSDLGTSAIDNLTSDTTPTMSATGGSTGDKVTITATKGASSVSCNYTVGSASSCDLSPSLAEGTWSVSATLTDPAGNVSLAGTPALSLTIDATAPSIPGAPDLAASSDSGSSSTDDITSDNTPLINVSGAAGTSTIVRASKDGTTLECTVTAGSCTLPALTDGVWSLTSVNLDDAGNESTSAAISLTVDSTSPTGLSSPDLAASSDSGSSSADNVTSDTTPTFSVPGASSGDTVSFTATKGASTETCSYVVGVATSCTLPALGDGNWSISGSVTDQAGNTASAGTPTSVVIDTTAPSAPVAPDLLAASDLGSSSTDNVTSDSTPSMSLVSASTGETVIITASNGVTTKQCTYVVGPATSCDLPTLSEGTWSVTATLTDAAGNISPSGTSMSLVLDTSAPSAPTAPDLATVSDLGTSSTDNLTADRTPTVSASGGVAGEVMTLTATKGSDSISCSYVIGTETACTLGTLGDGAWSLSATLTDAAGNVSSASSPALSVTIDATGPTGLGGPDLTAASDTGISSTDNTTSDVTPTMSITGGSSGDVVTLTATRGATTRSCSYTVGSATACDLPTLTDGTWSVSASVSDAAGNSVTAGSPLSIVIDTVSPTPTAIDLAAASDTGYSSTDNVTRETSPLISLTGLSDGDIVSVVATMGATTKTCSYTVGASSGCTLGGLSDGMWTVTASVDDAAGNAGLTPPSLMLTCDTTAPSSPSTPDLAASSDLGASSTDDLTSDSTPLVNATGIATGERVTVSATKGTTTLTCTFVASPSVQGCSLPTLSNGQWSVTATVSDDAGNTSAASSALLITIDAPSPRDPSGGGVTPTTTTTTTTTTTIAPQRLSPATTGKPKLNRVRQRVPVPAPPTTSVRPTLSTPARVTATTVRSTANPLIVSTTTAVRATSTVSTIAPSTTSSRTDVVQPSPVSAGRDVTRSSTVGDSNEQSSSARDEVPSETGNSIDDVRATAVPDGSSTVGSGGEEVTSVASSTERGAEADESTSESTSSGARDNGTGRADSVPVQGIDLHLLASILALAALSRRSDQDDDVRRLDNDERERSEVAEFTAGSGSGGLDDRADRFIPPASRPIDIGVRRLALRSHRYSPMIGRSLDDGSYLRALIGIGWPLIPVVGAALGVWAAVDAKFIVVLPALQVLIPLLVLGTLDAFAGLAAAAAYSATIAVGGGMVSLDSLRGLLANAGLMMLVGLVASAARPFRRRSTGEYRWARLVDAVLIPLFGAWAAGSMYASVPNLSGFDVAWSDRVGLIEIVALLTLLVRYGLENLARVMVASRLRIIENDEFPDTSIVQKLISRFVRGAVFTLVLMAFVGVNVWLVLGAAMFIVPRVLALVSDRLPNSETVAHWLPRGITRTVIMMFVMLWWGTVVSTGHHSAGVTFAVMSVPGLALGVIDLFSRQGRRWKSTPLTKIGGIAVLAIGIALVRGMSF